MLPYVHNSPCNTCVNKSYWLSEFIKPTFHLSVMSKLIEYNPWTLLVMCSKRQNIAWVSVINQSYLDLQCAMIAFMCVIRKIRTPKTESFQHKS